MKPGENLQRLILNIEKSISCDPQIHLASPKRLPDRDTGRLREHDVVLTFHHGHHKMIVAMECRDRSRPVGVPDVEAFKKKCERTGVHRGVIVSASGFTETARAKADSMDIGLMELEQTKAFNWCRAPGVVLNQRHLLEGPAWECVPEHPVAPDAVLFDVNDKPLDVAAYTNIAQTCLAQRPPEVAAFEDQLALDHPVDCAFLNEAASAFYTVGQGGEKIRIVRMVINVRYRVTQTILPISFHHYFNPGRDNGYEIGSVQVPLTEGHAALIIVKDDKGIKVSLIPPPAPPTQ